MNPFLSHSGGEGVLPFRLTQITGLGIPPGRTRHDPGELADPSPPFISAEQHLQIYGTGDYYLQWKSWFEFLTGGTPDRHRLDLRHPGGAPIRGPQAAWDLLVHEWNGEPVLYAGVMTPSKGRREARFPQDNWNRRIYAFRRRGECWIRESEPLFGLPLAGWIGHSYGHHFLEDGRRKTWVFYEQVTREGKRPGPYLTEIFARPMVSPFRAGEPELPILGVGEPPIPSTRRTIGGYLVEGPRPTRFSVKGRDLYLMGFSSGDFPTDRYGINLAFSREPLGPYQPLMEMTEAGLDFQDLGADLRRRYNLAWGPARPALFSDPWGNAWLLFHAVSKAVLADRDYTRWPDEPLHHFHRNLYLAPLRIDWPEGGTPSVTILG